MRTIDADTLKEEFAEYGETAKFTQSACQQLIDNAPTVEPFEPDYVGAERLKARQRGYEEGYHNGMEIGKTLNPKIKQAEWTNTSPYDDKGECPLCCYLSKKYYKFCPYCGAEMKGGAE